MSVTAAKTFLTTSATRAEIADQLLSLPAGDIPGFLAIAKAAGFEFSKEDWYTASSELNGGEDVSGQSGDVDLDELICRGVAFGVRG